MGMTTGAEDFGEVAFGLVAGLVTWLAAGLAAGLAPGLAVGVLVGEPEGVLVAADAAPLGVGVAVAEGLGEGMQPQSAAVFAIAAFASGSFSRSSVRGQGTGGHILKSI